MKKAREHKVRFVFLAAKWDSVEGAKLRRDLAPTMAEIVKIGATPVFVTDVPQQYGDPCRTEALRSRWPELPARQVSFAVYSEQTADVRAEIERLKRLSAPRFQVIDAGQAVCSWGPLRDGDKMLYSDDNHLTAAGALKLQRLFTPFFQQSVTASKPDV